ncbi:MAG: hypothetical protein RSD49_08080 [Hafnia sp.]
MKKVRTTVTEHTLSTGEKVQIKRQGYRHQEHGIASALIGFVMLTCSVIWFVSHMQTNAARQAMDAEFTQTITPALKHVMATHQGMLNYLGRYGSMGELDLHPQDLANIGLLNISKMPADISHRITIKRNNRPTTGSQSLLASYIVQYEQPLMNPEAKLRFCVLFEQKFQPTMENSGCHIEGNNAVIWIMLNSQKASKSH